MDPGKSPALYRHERWGAEQGFPGGGVHSIVQGKDGYLWLGTEKGLVRFDGTEFRLVPSTPARSTVAADVLGLAADADGSLWLRLDSPTLLRFRDGQFDTVPFASNPREVAVTAMTRGDDGGLLIYAQVSGLRAYRAGRFETRSEGAIPTSIVMSLAETPDGSIWMGTRDAGLFRLKGGSLSAVTRGLPDRKVNCLLAFGERELWVGTDRGIVRWNGSELTPEGVPLALRSVQALAMLRDRDLNLWVGASTGLLRADAQGRTLPEALPSSGSVAALYEDREGSLWVGDGDGVERLRDTPFTTFSRNQGMPSDSSGAIYADDAGRIWFAPEAGGLYRLEGEQVRRVVIDGHDDDRVYSIARARDGVWVGRQRSGLTHLRLDGDRVLARTYSKADGLAQASVYAVHESRDGSTWAGMLGGGLSRLRHGQLTDFTTADGLASNTVNALIDTHDGTLWAGTPAGLSAWSAGAWKTLAVADGLPSDNVIALLEDSAGVLWIGTAEGLAFLSSGRIKAPRSPPPSLHEAVLGIAEGEGGWLWIATARRVMRAKREALLQGPIGEADVVSYGVADGLLGVGGVKRHRSVVADLRGRIWISTNRGLSFVVPRRAIAGSTPPLVHVESLTADGRPIGLRDAVRVPPGPQRVRLGFTGVSLSLPERVRFRYRLDDFDQSWSEPASAQEAVYTNLPPGRYRFRVVASGGEGLWNGSEAILAFSIAPSVWQTVGFQGTAALLAAATAWLLYAWRLGRNTRRLNAAFEERLAERTRIAQELHDTLLQGFVSASMQLHVAVEQVPEGSPARTLLGRVQQLMRQVIEEGRSTVGGLRSAALDSSDLAEAFSRVREELAAGESAELRVIVEGTPRALHPSVRDELYRIGREALVNAFLHARASLVELELEYGRRAVRLLVRDDGVGIAPEVLEAGRDGHYGLSGMRERAERIGARLRLWSAPGAGTEVELVVRRSLAFASPARAGLRGWLRRLRRGAGSSSPEPQRSAPDPQGGGSTR